MIRDIAVTANEKNQDTAEDQQIRFAVSTHTPLGHSDPEAEAATVPLNCDT
ncbi:MAG: hypothetical protein AAF530_23850 [Pseudomonadota bacterium]